MSNEAEMLNAVIMELKKSYKENDISLIKLIHEIMIRIKKR